MTQKNGKIPVNIVMGELGSGKTTVIMNLVRQIAGDQYRVIWLKNEYGDVNVDGALAKEANITTTEIMNGCLCCTAIGNLETAMEQILEMKPDRVIIETAGTAHPAPIIMELKRFDNIVIDSVVEVIDAINFGGFGEPPVVRQSYNKYVDFAVVNKIGLVDARRLEEVLDKVYEYYPDMPNIQTTDGSVPVEAIIGLDEGSAARHLSDEALRKNMHEAEHRHMQAFSFRSSEEMVFSAEKIQVIIESLNKRDIWRAKGIIRTPNGWQVMNSVFSRVTWQPFTLANDRTEILFVGPSAKEHEAETIEQLTRTGE
ncbi:MAG: GTP-binding protein [Patescibacteria group bacterium]